MVFRIVLFLIAAMSAGPVMSQGIEFFHGSWEEALIEAQKQNKLIFVDCYTTWCGPCKRMARDVFPDAEVGEFYNQYFISVKMDMEKGEGPSFGKKYPVGAYPTLYYIKSDGEVVMVQRGARAAKDFIDLGKAALGRVDLSLDFRKAYESGDRSPEVVLNYVKALNRSDESSLRVVNDFLREDPSLDDSVHLAIVFEGVSESDSRPFTVLTSNKGLFEGVFGKEAVAERILQACEATAQKAIEFEYFPLVEQAVSEMKVHAPDHYREFSYTAPMDYHMAYHDWTAYKDVADDFLKKVVRKDAVRLCELAKSIYQNFDHEPEAVSFAESLLKDAVKYDDGWTYELELARFYLYQKKDKDTARKHAKEALKKAEKQEGNVTQVQQFIQSLDGKLFRISN